LPDGVARSDAATMFLPNTEASLHHPPIVAWLREQVVLEIKLAFAVIGEKQDDVRIKPIAHGATQTMLVAPEKEKERAKAKAKERAKAKAKAKERARAKVNEKEKVRAREADLDQARPAAEHHRETVCLLVDDRLLKTLRKRVSCTQRESVPKVMPSAHSYTTQRANGTKQVVVEMGQIAYSRTERREAYSPCSKHPRRNLSRAKRKGLRKLQRAMAKPKPRPSPRARPRRHLSDKQVRGVILAHPTVLRTAASPKLRHQKMKYHLLTGKISGGFGFQELTRS